MATIRSKDWWFELSARAGLILIMLIVWSRVCIETINKTFQLVQRVICDFYLKSIQVTLFTILKFVDKLLLPKNHNRGFYEKTRPKLTDLSRPCGICMAEPRDVLDVIATQEIMKYCLSISPRNSLPDAT